VCLEDLFAGRNIDIAAMQARMRGLMAEEGLPYGERTHTFNSRLAQELGAWATTQADGEGIHEALFHAYFVAGKNIGNIDTLVNVAETAGLSGSAARQVLVSRGFKDTVNADWQRARHLGVTGVPTFVAQGRGVVGAQPYEILERLVVLAGAQRRDAPAM
jgi:predicted DsbA family dithiol-disulfide isomerase